jgi:hypothetical protein
MTSSDDELWLDADAGRLVRPYAVTDGRTSPATRLDMLSLVQTVGPAPAIEMDPDRAQVLAICSGPTSVAELAARLRLPVVVTKIIISDLVEAGAVITRGPRADADRPDLPLLQAVLDGLRRRL